MITTKPYILEGKSIKENSNIQLCEKLHKYDYMYLDMNNLLTVEQNEEFHTFQSSLNQELIYTEENDYGIERNHHITAYYGLLYNQNNLNEIINFIKPIKSLFTPSLMIKGLTFFRNEGVPYDVMKFEIKSSFLTALHESINVLPNENTFIDYQPHMTVAYIKRGSFIELENKNDFSFCNIEIPIKEIVFQDVYDGKTALYI